MSPTRSHLTFLPVAASIALIVALNLPACKRSPPAPPAPTGRVTAGLTHKLSPGAPFAQLTSTERTVSYTVEGKAAGPDDPKIILVRSSKVYGPDENGRRIVSETFLSSLPEIKNAANFTTAPVSIDGLPGYETTAVAFSTKTGTKLRVFCTALFAADGSYYVVGLAPTGSELVDTLKAAAATLQVQ
ncbi:MAG: hypothetical protein H7210_00895 [Pyrinomonadaceae bacterium]|nr:hypothetical protein [Phycisphaerales bacterium]